jgi:putative transposase
MRRNPGNTLIFHSDRGSQYAGCRFRNLLIRYDITHSVSGKGNCYDNAVADSFLGTLKTDLGHQYESRSVARQRIF